MNKAPIQRIAIVGGGISAWTAAVFLARQLRALNTQILLIDSPPTANATTHSEDSACEFWLPSGLHFLAHLGVDEHQLQASGSSYSLAHRYLGWCDPAQDFFLSYAEHGCRLNGMAFAQLWLSQRPLAYDRFSLSASAARQNRFPPAALRKGATQAGLCYGLQVDNAGYLALLKAHAKSLHIRHLSARVREVECDSHSGFVRALHLDAEAPWDRVSADFYLDCSGSEALLMEQALAVPQLSAAAQLPVNRQASLNPVGESGLCSYVQLQADTFGYRRQIHTRTRVQCEYHFHSDHADDEQIARALGAVNKATHSKDQGALTFRTLAPGWRADFWHKNVLGLGRTSACVDSLLASPAHLLQSQLLRLLALFPAGPVCETNPCDAQAKEYNRLCQQELENLRDFHQLHYHLSQVDSPFWRAARATRPSEALQQRLALFRHRGLIPFFEGETFSQTLWTDFLLGQGVYPQALHPGVGFLPPEWIARPLEAMVQSIEKTLGQLPSARECLPQN